MKTGRCWNCQKFEEHFYWDHLEETSLRFMKVMEGNFSHQMEFPKKFARNFRVDLSDLISLKVSNGFSWNVRLFKKEDNFYLTDGWKEFIDAHEIKEGYSLCFNYAGNSSFAVNFFDQTGCFGDPSIVAIYNKNKAYKVKQTRLYRVGEVAPNSKRSRSSRVNIISSSRLPCDDYKLVHEISDSKSSDGSFSDETGSYKRKLKEKLEVLTSDQEVKLSQNWQGLNQNHIKLNGRLRSKTKEMIENSEYILKNPQQPHLYQTADSFFVRVTMKNHLCAIPFMEIPSDFLSEHFHIKPKKLILRKQKQMHWIVSCKFRNSSFGFIGKSFLDFVRDNGLKEGDVCVFKLISSGGTALDVRIVTAAEANSKRKSCLF